VIGDDLPWMQRPEEIAHVTATDTGRSAVMFRRRDPCDRAAAERSV